jgi:predicted DNA-binding transcriptional regulator AlpA
MEQHYSFKEISASTHIPLRTLYLYRAQGKGPKTVQIGKHLRVSESELTCWLTKIAS